MLYADLDLKNQTKNISSSKEEEWKHEKKHEMLSMTSLNPPDIYVVYGKLYKIMQIVWEVGVNGRRTELT